MNFTAEFYMYLIIAIVAFDIVAVAAYSWFSKYGDELE